MEGVSRLAIATRPVAPYHLVAFDGWAIVLPSADLAERWDKLADDVIEFSFLEPRRHRDGTDAAPERRFHYLAFRRAPGHFPGAHTAAATGEHSTLTLGRVSMLDDPARPALPEEWLRWALLILGHQPGVDEVIALDEHVPTRALDGLIPWGAHA